MEKLESHILVYDKKSNKSFSYSRHAQNYEHFLLPFPSFSNQSCLLIQLFSSSSFWHQGRSLLRWLKRGIPNCQTHHVRRSSPISQFLHTWLGFFFDLLLSTRDSRESQNHLTVTGTHQNSGAFCVWIWGSCRMMQDNCPMFSTHLLLSLA